MSLPVEKKRVEYLETAELCLEQALTNIKAADGCMQRDGDFLPQEIREKLKEVSTVVRLAVDTRHGEVRRAERREAMKTKTE